jgi:hypothetical protein
MQLVSIETDEEQLKLRRMIPKTKYENWWTSGTKVGDDWIWTATDQPFGFTFWSRNKIDRSRIAKHSLPIKTPVIEMNERNENKIKLVNEPVQYRVMLSRLDDMRWGSWEDSWAYEYSICEA